MQIGISFHKSISVNVTRWKIRRTGTHWLKIFSTTEEFDAWRMASVIVPEVSIPEVTSDNALLGKALVDDMITAHVATDQLASFGEPTAIQKDAAFRAYYTNISVEGQEEKVVELNSLWKILTGKQGDRALNATKKALGIDNILESTFPEQPGHVKSKLMPCANAQLLKKLLSGLDASILKAKQDLAKKVLADLGNPIVDEVKSRFAKFNVISNDNAISIVTEDDGTPRFVLFSVIKMFAPACLPSFVFYNRGVMTYLDKCGVKLPENLADAISPDIASAKSLVEPLWDNLSNDDGITDYEKMLGSKSSGLVWGHSTYDKGSKALHGDLPIFILVMMKLRTREARKFQGQALHQGVVMMGGNDQVALAISKHWRDERENTTTTHHHYQQPWKELLQFFGQAVNAEVKEITTPPPASAAASFSPVNSLLVEQQIRVLEHESERKRILDEEKLAQMREEREQKRQRREEERQRHEKELAEISARSSQQVEQSYYARLGNVAKALADGPIDQAEHDRTLNAIRPKRADAITIHDFVTKILRADTKRVSAVEREMKRRVESGEYPKSAAERDALGRILYFASSDRPKMTQVYQVVIDKINKVGEGQKRFC